MAEHFNYTPESESLDCYDTEYLEDEMEVCNEQGATSSQTAEFENLFSVKFIPSLRQFKGQTSAPKNAEFTILCSSVEDFFKKVLDKVRKQMIFSALGKNKSYFLRLSLISKDTSVLLKLAMSSNHSLTRN